MKTFPAACSCSGPFFFFFKALCTPSEFFHCLKEMLKKIYSAGHVIATAVSQMFSTGDTYLPHSVNLRNLILRNLSVKELRVVLKISCYLRESLSVVF